MCTRLRSLKSFTELPKRLPDFVLPNFAYNPNVAPTETLPIIRTSKGGLKITNARFGLVHSWAKDTTGSARFLNTRSDQVYGKPRVLSAYQQRRCIVPVSGFYEWREESGRKIPYYFHLKSGDSLPLIGLWEYAELDNEKIFSFSILTGEPNPLIAEFHDRMPLATKDVTHWLNLEKDALRDFPAYDENDFAITQMPIEMNNVRFKDIPDSAFES